jgi:adenine phosphoribosyltransferase
MDTTATKQKIAKALPYYPYKGIEKFYDVGTLFANVEARDAAMDLMAELCKAFNPTILGVLDARGFLFTPVAERLDLPLAMVRKIGKMPNTVQSDAYQTEYGHRDGLCVQKHVCVNSTSPQRMVLIDDLVATGGSLGAAVQCVTDAGIQVVGCVSVVELDAFEELRAKALRQFGVPRAALFMKEKELLDCGACAADVPKDYRDDGVAIESEGSLPKI